VDKISIDKAMKAMYPDDDISPMVMRAASTQAITSDPSWAGPLAHLSVSEAIEDIVSMSAFGKLMQIGALNVDLGRFASMVVPGRSITSADAGQWVAEGAPAPARQLHIIGPTLHHKKLEVIVTMTREMIDASNIEDVVRVLISEAASMALDAAIFSTSAATTAQPAGILNGLTPLTPSTATGFDGCGEDLGTLVADIATRGGGARAAFIGAPAQANSIKFWGNGEFATTGAAALANGTVVCIEPESFACAINAPEFSASTSAAIHQEDTTPANIGSATAYSVSSATVAAPGSGGVTGAAVYSVGGGAGTAATLNVTVAAGAITINSIANPGSYTTFPSSPAPLTYVSGVGSGVVGATANITSAVSASVVAAPVKSMFQIDAIAMKMILRADWCMRAPHVSFMSAVLW
jgi:hypothetical protein